MKQDNKKINPAKTEAEEILRINKLLSGLNDGDKMTKSVEAKPQNVDEVANKWKINNKIMDLFSEKIANDTKLKGRYATALIIILAIQLVLLNTWFVMKGLQKLSIADSTFNIFISGGIAEVFLLVRIIVKYLFSDNLSDLLKMVIRVNNIGANKNNRNRKN